MKNLKVIEHLDKCLISKKDETRIQEDFATQSLKRDRKQAKHARKEESTLGNTQENKKKKRKVSTNQPN